MGMAQNFAPAESYSIVYTSLYMSRPGSFLGHFYLIIAKFLLPRLLILSRAHTCICHTYPRVTRTMYQTGHKMVQGSHESILCVTLSSIVAKHCCYETRSAIRAGINPCQPPKPTIRQPIASSIFAALQSITIPIPHDTLK